MLIIKRFIKKELILLFSLLMIAVIVSPGEIFGEDAKWKKIDGYDFYTQTPLNAGLRSLVLPGWGQFFNQQDTKGYIYAGAALLTLTGSLLMYSKANDTYNEYEDKGIPDDSLYDDYTNQLDQSKILGYVTAAIWVWGAVDAYLFSPSSKSTAKANIEEGIVFDLKNNKEVALVYRKLF